MGRLINSLGGTLQEVIINRLEQATYFAALRIRQQDRLVEVDIRPSDAFNLAIRESTPIYITNQVLDTVALPENAP
jgi:bifunctional DNase/RNase